MKKAIFLCVAMMAIGSLSFAQNGAFKNGDKLLNVGIGVNSYYSGGIPVGASFEVGVTDDISVGGNIDFLSSNYGAGAGAKFTAIYFGARANYHFNEILNINNDQVDVYGGLTLGYRSFSWKDNFGGYLGNAYKSGLYLGALVGGKYYFTDNIGAFLELGAIGSTNARIGVAFKL
ncbi:MAG: hypothetical protein ABIP35_09715 [Ginsengibacter sp.]